MSTDKESSVAGTHNRPPMLVESDYESLKIRIERYIRGKPLGKLVWRSIQNGPTPHPQIKVTEGQGAAAVQVTRDKTDEEFTKIENNKELAYIQATNILSQGLPRHVFNILNQTRTGKEIWDNVEHLKKGTRGTQRYGQMTDNKWKLVICYNCRGEGHVSRHFLDAEAKAFLADVECTAPYDQPLAIMTINIFEVSHEDAYDSNVDEGPHAAATFMANLLSTSGINGATTSHVNEVHTDNNQIFDNVNHLLAHDMHQEEHLDFDVETVIDDNMIPYHQYQLDSEVQDAPNEVSFMSPGEISMITILDDLRNQLDGHLKVNQEQSMVNDSLRAELARCMLEIQTLERNKVKHDLDTTIVQHNKQNAELEQENMLLNSKLSQKVESINSLKTESKQLKDAITSVRIQNDRFKVENVNLKRRYQELSTSNSHSRDTLTRKITALTTENAKLKSESLSKMHSEPMVPKKPKVLAPGIDSGKVGSEVVVWLLFGGNGTAVVMLMRYRPLQQQRINVRVCVPKTTKYAELEKELEREKRKYEMIQQEKIGKSSSSEFVPWYEQDLGGMEVEELEQYLAALVELKRKALVRAGDLADMENASVLPLGPSTYRNNLPNTFHNDPLNMQVFRDGAKFESNTMIGPTNGLDFGDGNTMNGPTNNQYLGDGIKILNNTMNGPTSRQYFGDGAMIGSNTMNGPTNGLDFGDRIKFQNNTMNGHGVKNIESNTMNGPANGLYFGDGNNHENNTMNGHLDFGDLGLNKFY
uniref:Agamous-like MADS-box protein AGL62 n=1 Tax=Tanacetum cinerariifolium TaxID=118510 RepID=A0A6L2NFM7_TANCI|nr:agamous-like MADS-box protein AGL62 [Tanacetum cinerariifolium]